MTWLTRSAGRRSRWCPGCPGCAPGFRPVGRLITGLGAPGGSVEGGIEELEELRLSCWRRSRISASRSAIRCSAASKRARCRSHSGHRVTEDLALALMDDEDKSLPPECKRPGYLDGYEHGKRNGRCDDESGPKVPQEREENRD